MIFGSAKLIRAARWIEAEFISRMPGLPSPGDLWDSGPNVPRVSAIYADLVNRVTARLVADCQADILADVAVILQEKARPRSTVIEKTEDRLTEGTYVLREGVDDYPKGTRFVFRETMGWYDGEPPRDGSRRWEIRPFRSLGPAPCGWTRRGSDIINWDVEYQVDVLRILEMLIPDQDLDWLDRTVKNDNEYQDVLLAMLASGRVSREEISTLLGRGERES